MKNKAVLGTLAVLGLMIVGSVFYSLGQRHAAPVAKEKVKVGVLQFVTHDALDAINDGVRKDLKNPVMTAVRLTLTMLMLKLINLKSRP